MSPLPCLLVPPQTWRIVVASRPLCELPRASWHRRPLVGEECGPDTIDVPAAGVVVVMSSYGGPPIVPGALARPPSAIALADGPWAEASQSGLASDWTVSFPAWDAPLHVTARYAPPGVKASRSAVRALVLSLRLAKYAYRR